MLDVLLFLFGMPQGTASLAPLPAVAHVVPKIAAEPAITAKSFLVLDADTGTILAGKDLHTPLPVASLMKLMSLLVAREAYAADTLLTVPAEAALVEPAKLYLGAGVRVRADELMRASLIRSANDATLTLADNYAGGRAGFVDAMNARGRALGLTRTHFANPLGFDEARGFSTAYDVSLMARAFMRDDVLRGYAAHTHGAVMAGGKAITYETTNALLHDTSLEMLGLKTGTTDEAGECFVGLARIRGREVLTVVLGSADRFKDTKTLLSLVH